ncbi:hypothetical protein AB0F15_18765 [Amycolatopsis sp. NPDC026612]|uniref:hypothetical protein n=1 Tax=Amycolatopsis sp. NPDC026612 TaxID=3155466 RepID=UPI0033D658E7
MRLIAPAVCAAFVGAALAFGTFGLLQTGGPAEREEATVETVTYEPGSEGRGYVLALRTASGESLEVADGDQGLDLRPGKHVRLEISEFGRSVQAVEADGRRTPTGMSLFGVGYLMVLVLTLPLLLMLLTAAATARPVPAALSAAAGFLVGALPVVLLLF